MSTLVIVGCGVMGRAYAETLLRSNLRWRTRLVGVCDSNPEAAEALARETGARAFTDVAEMLRVTEPEAAYIAVPDHLHADPFFACIEAGIPVLVEKPLSTDPGTARAMRSASIDAGVYAECNFTNRSNPVFTTVKSAIDRGEVGEVIGINSRLSNSIQYPTSLLRWAADTSSGWFLLSHVFDLTTWLTGARAAEVTATGIRRVLKSRGVDTYDLIHALVRYDREMSGLYESSWTLPDSLPSAVDFTFEVLGTDGAIYVDTSDQMVHVAGRTSYTKPGTNNWTEARLSQFLDHVEGSARPDDPLGEALDNTLLLVALHEALETGGAVAVAHRDDALLPTTLSER
ncbi:Gfo/Idh/MocA family protein [Microbacterium lushaniae]|uniref:Gfo/Idh/MocA family oxidoreductase n=1 Tax=Microbacterium lushaniae TaxID=2614639 RepID=A0A5J6L7C0_9MICO|nr:Gfo/Idh/MocA family oxidoreductase [Microbacterium lushaniae]QEW04321.1 Gfo/Idh/MocA family oxidoreductase [Microbacterium lushaniae]